MKSEKIVVVTGGNVDFILSRKVQKETYENCLNDFCIGCDVLKLMKDYPGVECPKHNNGNLKCVEEGSFVNRVLKVVGVK